MRQRRNTGAHRSALVVFAPYPPARSGIADYVAEMMPYHRSEFDVTLVIADDAPLPADDGPRVLLASEYRKHRSYFDSAVKLYHIGNNAQHCYMLDFLGSDPGIVVLHDYNLCYLHEMGTLRWGNRARHVAQLEAEYGALGRDILQGQFQNEFRELFTGYELAVNGDVLERATAVITHSRQVQYRVAARVPRTPVWHVPHHLSPLASDYSGLSREAARDELGLSPNDVIVTAVGFVTRAKQIPMTLAALASLRGQVPAFRFVLAGERRPDEYDVDSDIAKSGLSDLVTCTDYLDEERFFKHLVASDIIVNLRYPSGGEMSGTLIRALGLGLPTVVLDLGPMGELPDNAVCKIAWDGSAQDSLVTALRELMLNTHARVTLGARAAIYARNTHDIGDISQRYNQIVRQSRGVAASRREPVRTHFPHPKAVANKLRRRSELHRKLKDSEGGMWWRSGGIPIHADETSSCLVVSENHEHTADLLHELFGWNPALTVPMTPDALLAPSVRDTDGAALAKAKFAFCLVIVRADLAEISAALLLRRLNAALCSGGSICIETTGDAADHPRMPLGRAQLPKRLVDAGFSSVRAWLPQDSFIVDLVAPDAEADVRHSACVSARKVSDYVTWRFADEIDGLPARWGGRLR